MTALHYTPGAKFGRMTVLCREPSYKVLCRCDCGATKTVAARSLKSGSIRSCGCLRSELVAAKNETHGQSKSKTYAIWSGIVTRCTNPARREYRWYGGAGIELDARWRKFENFLADMGEAPADLSIDRIDPTGPYSVSNCRWATTAEQLVNRTNTIFMTLNGKTKPLTQWADATGIPYDTLRSRRRLGWTDERALTTPGKK